MNETPKWKHNRPQGRAPKCYKKASKYSECPECVWYPWCKPTMVVQAVMHYDSTLDPPYEIVPTTLEKKAVE